MIDTAPDGRVFAYAFLLTLATGLLFGLLPALRASKRDLHTAMKGASTVGQRSEGRLQGALIGAQVALSMVLMIAAALLLRGLYEAQTVEPGFRYQGVAVASFDLTRSGYDDARAAVFQRQLVERVGALPGVDAVAQAQWAPLTGDFQTMAALPGEEQFFRSGSTASRRTTSRSLEIPIVRGRAFTADDETDDSTAVIVTEATARRLWPDRDPIGQKLAIGMAPNQVAEVDVVGVARDAQVTAIGDLTSSYVYLPAAPRTQRGLTLLVKSGDFAATAAAVRAVIAELDPGLAVRVTPLEANLEADAQSRARRQRAGNVARRRRSRARSGRHLRRRGVLGRAPRARDWRAHRAWRRHARRRRACLEAADAAGRDRRRDRPCRRARRFTDPLERAVRSQPDGRRRVARGRARRGRRWHWRPASLPARRASRVDPNVVLHYE